MTHLSFTPEVDALIHGLRGAVDRAFAELPGADLRAVQVGEAHGFYSYDQGVLRLSSGCAGPDMHHESEPDGAYRLDRWRRSVSSILEGSVLHWLAQRTGAEPDLTDWRWVGAAIEAADWSIPELQLGLPDLLRAANEGHPGFDPRQGVAVYRALRRAGEDPLERAVAWLTVEATISEEEWLDFGVWTMGIGLASEAGVPVENKAAVDIPVSHVAPWSWTRLDVPSHRRGGEVIPVGGAAVRPRWASGGERLRAIAGALGNKGEIKAGLGGPVGVWEQVSAHGFGQWFGIRGIRWNIQGSGRIELTLADAFAGPPEAIQMAEQVGTSGVVPGRWSVAGDHCIRLSELSTGHLTMHGRDAQPFMMPGGGGLAQALQSMEGGGWAWRVMEADQGEELRLEGDMMGARVELRFRRVTLG